MSSAVGKLQEILDCCRTGEPLTAEVADWLRNALQNYLRQRNATLEEALGLYSRRGGVPWRRGLSIRERDAALQTLARTFFATKRKSRQAALIGLLARRYAAANWPLDRESEIMPSRYAGTPRAFLWMAFMSGAPMPLSTRHLQSILGQPNSSGAIAGLARHYQNDSMRAAAPEPNAPTVQRQAWL